MVPDYIANAMLAPVPPPAPVVPVIDLDTFMAPMGLLSCLQAVRLCGLLLLLLIQNQR